jgi:hypothetical protein
MPKFKTPGTNADLPVGIFSDFDRGYRSGKSVLCHFYGASCVNLYSQSTWTAVEYSLNVFAQIPDDEPWGRIQWGNNPWDAVEVKDKWEFMEKYIRPIVERGRPLISQYDEITQATFQRCESVLQEQEARKARAIALSEQPKEAKEQEIGKGKPGPGRGNKTADYNQPFTNPVDSKKGGTDPEYLMARLARDYPEVVEQVKAGEFPSVRAAAVAAGIVKPRLQFTVGPSTTPQAFAGALFERLEPEFLDEFAGAFFERLDPEFLAKLLEANRG